MLIIEQMWKPWLSLNADVQTLLVSIQQLDVQIEYQLYLNIQIAEI